MTIFQDDERQTSRFTIVALATAWGPEYGGINAFNTELVKSLGIRPSVNYDLVCVVPGHATLEVQEEALRFHFRPIFLDGTDGEFVKESASGIARRLEVAREPHRFIWIGHDDKSGPLALKLKSMAAGSHAVLINHMAHGAYQSVKKGNSLSASENRRDQFDLFRKADLCIAVGPMLRSHLEDMLACLPNRPPVEMLVPGLSDPTEYGIEIRDSAPENFVGFIAGRLEREDDRIKQGHLALRGFGRAVRDAGEDSSVRRSPTLRMLGIRPAEEEALRDALMQEAARAVNFDFRDFVNDRIAYFSNVASASVVMMPSWHEGFGLTAWEAIASALPVVISEESGVYRLLKTHCSGAGLGQSVAHIQVEGWLPSNDTEPNHTEEDVARVSSALLLLAQKPTETKQQALTLRRNLLALGLDWRGTAFALVNAIERTLGISLTAERTPTVPAQAAPPVREDMTAPEGLRLPAPRVWRRELQLPTSILLTARDEIVRFDPDREGFLAQMRDWTAQHDELSARLVYGPGGMGKTRLAFELARRLQSDGWVSVWLAATLPEDCLRSWKHLLRARGKRRLLLVIDYADARLDEVLVFLNEAFELLRTSSRLAPLRLLLLARSGSWLASLPKHTSCPPELAAWLSGRSAINAVAIPQWSSDVTVRLKSYRLALKDYAAATGLSTGANDWVPRLSDRVFDRPLYLHLAALAALEGQRPASAEALLQEQLRREWRYWRLVHGDRTADYDDWADALAYVILCQGAHIDDLQRALNTLGIAAPALVVALASSYPAGDGIAALEPDLIAEAMLRERLAERRGSALLDAVLTDDAVAITLVIPVIARLAAQTGLLGPDEPAWARVLTAALARHWPSRRDKWRAAVFRAEHGLDDLLFAAYQLLDELVFTAREAYEAWGTGTIGRLTDKGFGFIRTELSPAVFFHSDALLGVTFDELKEGDVVSFEMEHTREGWSALHVTRC